MTLHRHRFETVVPDRPVGRLDDIPDGHSRGFDPLGEGRDTMFVVRRGDAVFAYRNHCPHYDRARMAWKKDEFMNGDRSAIMCSAHGALFAVEDGACTQGPCLGLSLYPVAVELRDGEIWITEPYAPGFWRERTAAGACTAAAAHPA